MHGPQSSRVVVAAPMSFAGSAQRIWKLASLTGNGFSRAALGFMAVLLIVIVWALVLCWYLLWGIWLIPYRLIRRGQRRDKQARMRHAELLQAMHERDR